TRIRNLLTGQTYSRNFKPADMFEEADIEKRELLFLYHHRGDFVFTAKDRPAERFTLDAAKIGDAVRWLKPETPVTALFLEGTLVDISVPIKMDFRVIEAPPSIKGDTATGGTKTITIETGAKIQTPLFVNEGDIVRVNTETGEYAERVEKGERGKGKS
ncbi:MAG: elongation factor P, partial [bacterium]|nr:elongation factor P [bacterium]